MIKEELLIYTTELARRAGEDNPGDYASIFVENILPRQEILDEYIAYLSTGKFKCDYSIAGRTIADIIIWQMDHFKSLLDNHLAMNKGNEYKMVLGGFTTMMEMEDNPQKLVSVMGETSGTDYLGKY